MRTHFQVTDALTKAMDPDLLIEVLSTGKVTLQGEVQETATTMDCCKTGTGDAVSEGTEGFSEREEAAESLEIVVQLRRVVEISSFTTFP